MWVVVVFLSSYNKTTALFRATTSFMEELQTSRKLYHVLCGTRDIMDIRGVIIIIIIIIIFIIIIYYY